MSCASTPCPGVIVAQACVGAPVDDPSIMSMDSVANRKAVMTAQQV